jgi:hypothetical protein
MEWIKKGIGLNGEYDLSLDRTIPRKKKKVLVNLLYVNYTIKTLSPRWYLDAP